MLGLTIFSPHDGLTASVPPLPDTVEALMILSGGTTCDRGQSIVVQKLQIQRLRYLIWLLSFVCALLCPLHIPY